MFLIHIDIFIRYSIQESSVLLSINLSGYSLIYFTNSLIIHEEKTKEISVGDFICDYIISLLFF